jgi:hypothetical protein
MPACLSEWLHWSAHLERPARETSATADAEEARQLLVGRSEQTIVMGRLDISKR